MTASLAQTEVGQPLSDHHAGPISRTVLALFAGASGDHNPMHIDIDFARRCGMDDVFAHGMLSMAYLAQLLTRLVPPERIRSYSVRFAAITPVNARVRCTAPIVEQFEAQGERRARLELATQTDAGTTTLIGEAVIAIEA
ncbi:MAG: dehydratase [Sphingomonadales bacterium]|nr:dehydratase [Sphingomonadales bacterium]